MTAYPYSVPLVAVTIAGVTPDPEVFGGLVAATAYLGASSSTWAEAWMALASDSAKGKRLVDATRYLDALTWQDITDADLLALAQAAIPKAKPGTSVEFFRATSAAQGTATRLPVVIQRLIGRFLGSTAVSVATGVAYGTDGVSSFDACDDADITRPL